MKTRSMVIFACAVILISIVAGVLLYDKLPDQMASHWNINDEVDGYMSKLRSVFLLPLVLLGLLFLFLLIPHLDPLKENIAEFRKSFNIFILMTILFLAYIWLLTIFWNLGFRFFKMSTASLPWVCYLPSLATCSAQQNAIGSLAFAHRGL